MKLYPSEDFLKYDQNNGSLDLFESMKNTEEKNSDCCFRRNSSLIEDEIILFI